MELMRSTRLHGSSSPHLSHRDGSASARECRGRRTSGPRAPLPSPAAKWPITHLSRVPPAPPPPQRALAPFSATPILKALTLAHLRVPVPSRTPGRSSTRPIGRRPLPRPLARPPPPPPPPVPLPPARVPSNPRPISSGPAPRAQHRCTAPQHWTSRLFLGRPSRPLPPARSAHEAMRPYPLSSPFSTRSKPRLRPFCPTFWRMRAPPQGRSRSV